MQSHWIWQEGWIMIWWELPNLLNIAKTSIPLPLSVDQLGSYSLSFLAQGLGHTWSTHCLLCSLPSEQRKKRTLKGLAKGNEMAAQRWHTACLSIWLHSPHPTIGAPGSVIPRCSRQTGSKKYPASRWMSTTVAMSCWELKTGIHRGKQPLLYDGSKTINIFSFFKSGKTFLQLIYFIWTHFHFKLASRCLT